MTRSGLSVLRILVKLGLSISKASIKARRRCGGRPLVVWRWGGSSGVGGRWNGTSSMETDWVLVILFWIEVRMMGVEHR
ncbi:hypothetical protein RHMOL_Rhmol09G0203600 [Rhododendron molle]|uniref:Uncharacterized protein n=1 Tax=Rhododendron molle TaxID=49168 RepID=A0ACC0MGS5_RHOML|nr:hypothetical protein RHMOL_Rhmol09G0203600 [Rhododendron molle]